MRRAANDAADVHGARQLRLAGIADIVLTHLAGAPAGDVEKLVVHRQIDVGDQRRHRAKSLQQRRQLLLGRRFRWNRRRLLDVELAALAPPGPDRAFEVGGVDHDAEEAVLANRIVRRPHLQRHLMIGAEIDGLDVFSGPQIPEVDPMAILVREQILRHDPVFELRRQRPLARHHVIARQVPPEVIMQRLRTAVDLPPSEHLEGLAVHDEDAGRPVGAILATAAKRADIDAVRAAVNRVRPRVAGLREDFLGLDDFVNFRLRRIRLGIDDINPRRPDARDDEIAPLEEGVPGKRRQRRRAGIPPEMVKLVALVRHRDGVDDLAVGRRSGLHVDHRERIGFREVRAEQQGIGKIFGRRFHGELRRCVEGRVGPDCHRTASLLNGCIQSRRSLRRLNGMQQKLDLVSVVATLLLRCAGFLIPMELA